MTFIDQAHHYFKAADDMADELEEDTFLTKEQKVFAREAIKKALMSRLESAAAQQWWHILGMVEDSYAAVPKFDEGHPFSDSDEVPY